MCDSGTSLWLILPAMQCMPSSECIAKAMSSTDEPAGSVYRSPLGVNTYISRENRLSLMVSSTSMALGSGFASMSLIVRIQLSSSVSSSYTPLLYFQCAAYPSSAMSSIFRERICTSIHFPSGPIAVRCSARYPLAFGTAVQSRSRSGWTTRPSEKKVYICQQRKRSSESSSFSNITRTA